jgi:hypothetical protein
VVAAEQATVLLIERHMGILPWVAADKLYQLLYAPLHLLVSARSCRISNSNIRNILNIGI